MNNDKPQQVDVTARLNALVDDLADLAADLHLEGKLSPRPPLEATDSKPRKARRTKTRLGASIAAPVSAAGAGSLARADAVASTAEPERTRLLVLISAWWTLGQMTNTGVSFQDFIQAAVSNDPRAKSLWDDSRSGSTS